jgi:ParB-like chromosome segregation protein Spo0J
LVASIGQTGFWDNILARKKDDQIQIAYGHHRLAALRQCMKPNDTVDIPVKPLDDATMLKIMANENMDE